MSPETAERFDIMRRCLDSAQEHAENKMDSPTIDWIQHIRNEINLLKNSMGEDEADNAGCNWTAAGGAV